ncbi:MAG TPA: glycosyl hydrolase family 28-related protein, partial [Candidatus Saccharimonadales bacterium]|nr:glycosyl hydrolase family 28-related protein [Candidatus Saccharimonadales bacterium]
MPVVILVSAFSLSFYQNRVEAATSGTINFQARLLTAAGNVVPDGYYNVEFKLYSASASDSGQAPISGSCTTTTDAGNTTPVSDEDCIWTETRINGDKVRVANGYLTVNLGSVTAFPSNVNWDQNMWLSMNIGGTGSASWDGEMNPRLKLTAVPYAFTSGKVVSADGTGSATAANGESGTICIQGSVNCGFIKSTTSTLQTADTNLSIQSASPSTAVLNLRGAMAQSASLFKIQGYNGAIVEDLVEVNSVGALTLHGPGTVGFVTPNGQTVATKIRIPLYDPGSFGQVLMFGVPAAANTTSRALTVVDARTGAHQPSIAVLSPNENEVFGLSWDGSNSTAGLKTSSAQIVLRTGSSTDVALFTTTGINLNQDTAVASGKVLTVSGTLRASTIDASAAGQNIEIGGTNALGINLNEPTAVTAGNFTVANGSIQASTIDGLTAGSTLSIGTTNATNGINLQQNVTVAAGKGLTLTGGNTASRPASPAEGTIYFDTTTKQLLVYANGKWQSDRSSTGKTVSMGATTGCTGSVPSASLNADAADYVVTSCTSAQTTINSAITALGSTGGTVYLMEGTYIIDGTINLASNVSLVGAGQATVLKFKNASSASLSMFTASSINRIKISNLRLDGNRANNGSASSQTAISLTSVGSGAGVTAVPGIQITEMTIEGFLYGVVMNTVANSSVTDSYFGQNTLYAIDTNTTGSRVTIADNKFYNNSVETLGPTHWTVTGNSFDSTSNGNYLLDMLNSGNSYHTITGNTFSGNGLSLSGSQNTVSGNTITTTNQNGINISGGANVISGNKVHDTAGSTFSRIVISGSNNTITGNDLTAASGTGYAINIANIGAANNTLSNNRFSGTGSSSINDAGKDTIYNGQANGTND